MLFSLYIFFILLKSKKITLNEIYKELDYLLDNIVDPSSVVSTDYRMNVIELKDGRVLSGMISGQDRNSLTLLMPGSEILVSKSDIKKKQVLNTSIMPAGLLDNIGPDERRNLIGYLMHPQKVP